MDRRKTAIDPTVAQRYFNRESSWLAFNRRVLEEAQDEHKPLLERARFLAIVSSNLDEFVMVRLAELRALAKGQAVSVERATAEQAANDLSGTQKLMRSLVGDQYRCWREQLVPAFAQQGYAIVAPDAWRQEDRDTLRRLYHDQLEPMLTPLAVDPTRPFPLVANKGVNVAVQLETASGARRNALVSVPSANRVISLAAESGRFALVEDVVANFLDSLFPGYRIVNRCLFRVIRDGELDIDEEQTANLLSEIEQELQARQHGHVVRLEIDTRAEPTLRGWLLTSMEIDDADAFDIDGPLDLTFLFGYADKVNRPDLRDQQFPSVVYPTVWDNAFARIRQGEILLHHPYQSFQPVVDLVAQAAADPQVMAIKQTLYRVSGDSPIVRSLIQAARAGKQVTVLIELKARFDEATNIKWARRLEEAGAHVIYGLMRLKVHAKLLMIIRREDDGICRYVHIGTGNYNDKTARLYTDLSYMTCNEAVGRDVAALFNMLTGYSQPPEWERLAVAPLTLRKTFTQWIRREAEHAKAGRAGRIIAKFNALVDEQLCEELYAASAAGVEIDLIVRGMCILRPGVPGLSERIRVRSLVGRFLEHHRIYFFGNGGVPGQSIVAISSADWMTRNLDRRVECLVRIENADLQLRLMRLLEIYLEDNAHARVLLPDGAYRRLHPRAGEEALSSLEMLLHEAVAASGAGKKSDHTGMIFRPKSKHG